MKNVFKLLTVVCLVATMTTLTSCKKSNEDLIVGTWKCTSVTCEPQNPFMNLLVGCNFTFNADKTLVTSIFDEQSTGTYAVDGNKLTMTVDGETIVADIKSLDKKNLSFAYTEEDEDDEGNPVTVTVTMNFDKQ